jgi:hypothetical protein
MSTGRPSGAMELAILLIASFALAAVLTYPVGFKMGHVARTDADSRYSIWNVAWVAHALTSDPLHVLDANIFYPHRRTLTYSEANLVAGFFATPVYAATRNPYAAHNFVLVLAFALAVVGTYYLVRYLVRDRRAAVISGISFGFCPFAFAHLAHIQLLMTAGLPLSLLAFHRMADRPSVGRGAVLGLAMAAQALACGYYGVFAILAIGFAFAVIATTRRLWTSGAYWRGILAAAVVSIAIVLPIFVPYTELQGEGFARDLESAARYSPNWSAYFASSSHAHAWMLNLMPPWKAEVLFPGFLPSILAVLGLVVARRAKLGEAAILYGGLAALAFWLSFGPGAVLYRVLYPLVPGFTLLRVPARFGLVVTLCVAVLAGVALAHFLRGAFRSSLVGVAGAFIVTAELVTVPLPFHDVEPLQPVYRTLATLPRGPVIEMPFYYPAVGLYQHTRYMVASTSHWFPLVNGYSDYMPPDFYEHVMTLATFPSPEAMKILEPGRVRYAIFHMYLFNDENRRDVLARLKVVESYLRPLYQDEATRLYEIVGYPK